MVRGVNDQEIMSSPEGPNKADHGDSVTACMSKRFYVKEGPFTSQITENPNANNTTPNLHGFKYQGGNPSTKTKHSNVLFEQRQCDSTEATRSTQEQGRTETNHPI